MDIGIFDNFDDDGQLTLFGMEEDFEELPISAEETAADAGNGGSGEPAPGKTAASAGEQRVKEPLSKEPLPGGSIPEEQGGVGIRIRSCSSCGKLLFVREEEGGYVSVCNACGIQYVQK